mmetsp:Transcript_17438/g.53388  ORF Transcript_17438/g.53388 Transcript_17438/m.53388 type:complete len:426 (-) Transcript_17438:400-1677(-)
MATLATLKLSLELDLKARLLHGLLDVGLGGVEFLGVAVHLEGRGDARAAAGGRGLRRQGLFPLPHEALLHGLVGEVYAQAEVVVHLARDLALRVHLGAADLDVVRPRRHLEEGGVLPDLEDALGLLAATLGRAHLDAEVALHHEAAREVPLELLRRPGAPLHLGCVVLRAQHDVLEALALVPRPRRDHLDGADVNARLVRQLFRELVPPLGVGHAPRVLPRLAPETLVIVRVALLARHREAAAVAHARRVVVLPRLDDGVEVAVAEQQHNAHEPGAALARLAVHVHHVRRVGVQPGLGALVERHYGLERRHAVVPERVALHAALEHRRVVGASRLAAEIIHPVMPRVLRLQESPQLVARVPEEVLQPRGGEAVHDDAPREVRQVQVEAVAIIAPLLVGHGLAAKVEAGVARAAARRAAPHGVPPL